MRGETGDGKRDGNGKGRLEWVEWEPEQGKGGSGASGEGSRERRMKRRTLFGDVQEYYGVYTGEGTNTI